MVVHVCVLVRVSFLDIKGEPHRHKICLIGTHTHTHRRAHTHILALFSAQLLSLVFMLKSCLLLYANLI